jgi:hypothetical protein
MYDCKTFIVEATGLSILLTHLIPNSFVGSSEGKNQPLCALFKVTLPYKNCIFKGRQDIQYKDTQHKGHN